MKRYGYLYNQMCSFSTLYAASHRALKGHKSNAEAAEFCFNLDRELDKLQRELKENSYQPQEYHYFEIYEPKQRTISVASFRDRVVHHALIATIEPIFEKSFIHHSYATRKNKGSLAAIKQAQRFLRRYDWYLKLDIRKYFDSIDHQVLMSLLKRKIKDGDVLQLCAKILATGAQGSEVIKPIGLPIGNLSSQFFANVYLDSFDHFVLEDLHFPMIRYMDDILLFADDKTSLKTALKSCESYLQDDLQLIIKEGSVLLNTRVHGLPFLGFRIFPELIRLQAVNAKRMVAKIKLRQYEYETGLIDEEALYRSVQSMLAFADYADSHQLVKRISSTLG
jgi:RNA-directed DNA polymerase